MFRLFTGHFEYILMDTSYEATRGLVQALTPSTVGGGISRIYAMERYFVRKLLHFIFLPLQWGL